MDALGLRVVAPRREQGVRGVIARAIARRMILFEKHETLVERSTKILTRFSQTKGVDTRRQVSVSPKSRSARTAVVAPEARARGLSSALSVFSSHHGDALVASAHDLRETKP